MTYLGILGSVVLCQTHRTFYLLFKPQNIFFSLLSTLMSLQETVMEQKRREACVRRSVLCPRGTFFIQASFYAPTSGVTAVLARGVALVYMQENKSICN